MRVQYHINEHIYTCTILPQVGAINFHPYYNDPEEKVTGEADTSGIVQIVCSDDIMTGDNYMKVSICYKL